MEEFSDIFITSNQLKTGCLHVKPGDRRQLLIEVSDLKLQNRKFFRAASEETRNLDIAHAWYLFFKNKELGEWTPAEDPPGDVKEKTIEHSMVKSHRFI